MSIDAATKAVYAGYEALPTNDSILHNISNPAKAPLDEHLKPVAGQQFYWQPSKQDRKVIVYVVEKGYYPKSFEKGDAGRMLESKVKAFEPVKWNGPNRAIPNPDPYLMHGVCVASRIGGTVYGTAKSVNTKILVVQRPPGAATEEAGWAQSFKEISSDFNARKEKDNNICGVMNLSSAAPITNQVKEAFESIITAGIIVVGAAGNTNTRLDAQRAAEKLPEAHADTIVVGAVDSNNLRAAWSNGGTDYASNYGARVDIWCQGVDVEYFRDGDIPYRQNGTSHACPIVAGVVATMLAAKQVEPSASKIKALLKEWAFWVKIEEFPSAILRNGPAPEKLRLKAQRPAHL